MYMRLFANVKKLLKSLPEVHVKDGVNDGVQRGVEVAEPGYKVDDFVTGFLAGWAEWNDDVHEKEWKPADDKHAHNDS